MCELSRHNEDKNIIDRLQDGTTSERGKSRAVRQEFLYIRLAAVALWDCNSSIHSVNLAPLSFLPSVRPSLFRSPWMSYRNDRKILCNEIIFTFVITVIVLVFTPSVVYPVVLSGFLSAIVTNFSIRRILLRFLCIHFQFTEWRVYRDEKLRVPLCFYRTCGETVLLPFCLSRAWRMFYCRSKIITHTSLGDARYRQFLFCETTSLRFYRYKVEMQ